MGLNPKTMGTQAIFERSMVDLNPMGTQPVFAKSNGDTAHFRVVSGNVNRRLGLAT